MNDNQKEKDKQQILHLVSKYWEKYHQPGLENSEHKNKRIPYASRVYDSEEMENLVDSALEFWLTSGRYTEKFEREFADFLNIPYCLTVNSGSSANLLAFMALTSPLLGDRAIRRGDEVITVACGFPTTIAPIIQYGAIPVFVDVVIPEYNIDASQLENALSKKTKAVMLAHTLGNPFHLRMVKEFCSRHKLWLIEDNCDALGAQYALNEETRYTGTFGDIGTSSFYPPHHMTMGEGGAVYTSNPLLHKILRSLRDWGRDCVCPSGIDNLCGRRFDGQFGELPSGYDHKYVYSHFGYNLKITDMQAAVGVAQLKKVPGFIQKRNENFLYLYQALKDLNNRGMILPKTTENADPSWFGFPITLEKPLNRKKTIEYLERESIQTRLLFSGNLIRHPCFDSIRKEKNCYRVVGSLTNTDTVTEQTFWVGIYPGLTQKQLERLAQALQNIPEISR